jgi:hypothetical protein
VLRRIFGHKRDEVTGENYIMRSSINLISRKNDYDNQIKKDAIGSYAARMG